ncbi:type III secretion component, partial [Pseudomonas savastanoi pv. glycinea str. race 4]
YLDRSLPVDRFQVELEGVPVSEGEFSGMALLLQDDPVHAQLVSVETFEAPSPIGSRPGRWAGREHADRLQDAGIGFLFADEVLREVLDRTLRRYAADFLGIQETRLMLEQLEGKYGELIKEVLRILPLQRIAEALRLLVSEGVLIRSRRGLLESMVEWGSIESDAGRLTEHLRAGLARQISHQYADRNRVISAFVLAPALEEQLRATLARQEKSRDSLPDDIGRTVLVQLRRLCDMLPEHDLTVLLVHSELRRCMRRLIVRGELQLAV